MASAHLSAIEEENARYHDDRPFKKLRTHLPAYALTGALAGIPSVTASHLVQKYTSPVPKDVRLTGKWAHTLRAGATGACLRFSGFAAARIGVQEGIIRAGGKEGRRMVDNEDWVTVGVTGLSGAMGGAFEAACLGYAARKPMKAVLPSIATQGGRVGICFFVYSFLSNYSPFHPVYEPPIFPVALVYGTIAGLWGASIMQYIEVPDVEQFKTLPCLAKIGRMAVGVGVVISVQNQLVRWVLG